MYQAVIGLECHTQLHTRSKLFCGCENVEVGATPNSAICEVCTGHPGTLPVLNDEAVRLAVVAALATGCTIHDRSVFSRKQYFYPDLPKGYQISQYDRPIAETGSITALVDDQPFTVRLNRIHIEEDAGKSSHHDGKTGVDFNRAGTPLVEIVSEPDMHTPEQAEAFARMLHRVVVKAGVTLGDMEKGHFRIDANISVHRPGEPLGTRTEVKNLNSFRFLAKAIEYEIERQTAVLLRGDAVHRETRTWRGDRTESIRTKEAESDYRYFPEPDLGPLEVSDADRQYAREHLPGAPLDLFLLEEDAREREGFLEQYALDETLADILLAHPGPRSLFETAVEAGGDSRKMANWVVTDVLRLIGEGRDFDGSKLTGAALARLQSIVDSGRLAHHNARTVLEILWSEGGDPARIVEDRGLTSVSDEGMLREAMREAIAAHPKEVQKYKQGNTRIAQFFMGQLMRVTRGRADPALATRIVAEELENTP